MRKSYRCAVVASVLIVLLATPRSALCWGNEGHEAVACIAWRRLSQPTKDKVFALLQQVPSRKNSTGSETIPGFAEWSQSMPAGLSVDDQHMYIFMRAATWSDSIKHKFLEDSDTPPSDMSQAESNLGFTDAFSHGYWHFVDGAFGTPASSGSTPPDVPKSCWDKKTNKPPVPVDALPKTPVPNAQTEITLLSTDLASDESASLKAYDMIWLEHLVGDIHQPLHASTRFVNGIDDIGANCVDISVPKDLRPNFASSNPKAKPPAELHAFWDDLPGVATQMETQKAVTYADSLTAADAAASDISDPVVWSQESFDMAVKDAYASPIGPALGVPKPYLITDDYYKMAAGDAKTRIALAGARLANLLTKSLQ